jgi:hypothetical protein
MSQATRYIAILMEKRAKRVRQGLIKLGIVVAGLQLLTMFKFGFLGYWQAFATVVFFTGMDWLYSVRSRYVALCGKLMITKLEKHEFIFGTDFLYRERIEGRHRQRDNSPLPQSVCRQKTHLDIRSLFSKGLGVTS